MSHEQPQSPKAQQSSQLATQIPTVTVADESGIANPATANIGRLAAGGRLSLNSPMIINAPHDHLPRNEPDALDSNQIEEEPWIYEIVLQDFNEAIKNDPAALFTPLGFVPKSVKYCPDDYFFGRCILITFYAEDDWNQAAIAIAKFGLSGLKLKTARRAVGDVLEEVDVSTNPRIQILADRVMVFVNDPQLREMRLPAINRYYRRIAHMIGEALELVHHSFGEDERTKVLVFTKSRQDMEMIIEHLEAVKQLRISMSTPVGSQRPLRSIIPTRMEEELVLMPIREPRMPDGDNMAANFSARTPFTNPRHDLVKQVLAAAAS